MNGSNFVELIGKVKSPQFKVVGDGHKLFRSKIAVPTSNGGYQYIKVAGWRSVAEGLNELPENTFVKIHGHIEERSYDGKCRHCGGTDKKYWTEVIVDNFVVANEEE